MPLDLRPYQKDGIKFLRDRKRAALHDEPGIGKTVQAIHAAVPPVLIACPTYLTTHWRDSILTEYPEATVAVAEGLRTRRQEAIAAGADFTVINVEMFRDYPLIRPYRTLILDEAHHLRKHTSQQYRGAFSIARKPTTEYVFELTATPVKREADDLFAQLALLDPKRFTHPKNGAFLIGRFRDEWCKTVDIGYTVEVVGVRDPERLREMLAQYALRRTYVGTRLQLPDLIEQPIRLTPTDEWYKAYRSIRDDYRIEDITFESAPDVMRTLRHLTADLKTVAAKQLHDDTPGGAVFYTWYKDFAHTVARELNIPCITGEMNPQARAKLAANTHGSIVATIASLSEGVDLSHIHTVAFLEQSYLPGDTVQALARVRRWNTQNLPVRVVTVTVERTIDTTIERTRDRRAGNIMLILRDELEKSTPTISLNVIGQFLGIGK